VTAVNVVYDDLPLYSRHNVLVGRIGIPIALQSAGTSKGYCIMNRGKPSSNQTPQEAVLVVISAPSTPKSRKWVRFVFFVSRGDELGIEGMSINTCKK
jgi:hypothetical protein